MAIPSLSHSWIILDSRLYPFMKFVQAIHTMYIQCILYIYTLDSRKVVSHDVLHQVG